MADLNAQAKAWTDGPAFDRPWPEGEQLAVRQAFQAESPSLMALPMDAYLVDARVEVTVAKTPYVRFDLDDYSIPHTHVRRTVTVLASAVRVRSQDHQHYRTRRERYGYQNNRRLKYDTEPSSAQAIKTMRRSRLSNKDFPDVTFPLHSHRPSKGRRCRLYRR